MLKYVKGSAELLTFDVVRYGDNVARVFAFLKLNFENDSMVHTKLSSMVASYTHDNPEDFVMEHCFKVSRYSLEDHTYTPSTGKTEWQSFDSESLTDYYYDVERLVREKFKEKVSIPSRILL